MLVRVIAYAAAQITPVGPALAVGFGFVLATFGHIIRSRLLILLGLLIIGGVSAYITFVWGGLSAAVTVP
ncbi:MAG TPA: hypothetical protein VGH24_09575 [Solirubrobacteraceae bacterium]|jgi:hypothetical protein